MNPNEIKGLAYLTYSGSIAYGTNIETSDTDIRGFYQETVTDIITGNSKDTITYSAEDTVIYSLRKFVRLCRNANPNVLELLGTKDEHILFINDVGKLFRDNKEVFFSRKAFNSFGGFATSEIGKLRSCKFFKVNEKWYKAAMHAVRLLLMGADLLNGNGLIVYRENDLGLLTSIRRGEIERDEIIKIIEELNRKLAVAYDNSKLPYAPDDTAMNKLLMKAYEMNFADDHWRIIWG